jgi:transcriptional regulator with XRE-family HTH domain
MASLAKSVAMNLKELREKRGLTQEEVADLCGMEYKQYQRYESTKPVDMRLSTIEKIAKGLKVDPTAFFKE